MAGKIKFMIDKIIADKSKGNDIIASSIKTKLILKGINVKNYTANSPDDLAIIASLRVIAEEFGVKL